jgi:hypothetical protein
VPFPLHDGDELRVGQTVLRVEVSEEHPSATDARQEQADDAYAACI